MVKKLYNKEMYSVKKPVDLSKLPAIKGYDFSSKFDYLTLFFQFMDQFS